MKTAQVWYPTRKRNKWVNWHNTWEYRLLCEYINQLVAIAKEQNGRVAKDVREVGSKIA